MVVFPIFSGIYDISLGISGLINNGDIHISTQHSGGVLNDPKNVLIWGVGYFSMLIIFELLLKQRQTEST
jgi:hypothetical protein